MSLKKVSVFVFFLAFSFVGFISAQVINIDIKTEEIMRWNKKAYHVFHLNINTNSNEYTDKTLIKEICNYLQRNDLLSDVNLNKIELIDDDQFDKDLELGDWMGGHPIFEPMYGDTCGWHSILYKRNLYILKGNGYGSIIFKLVVTG